MTRLRTLPLAFLLLLAPRFSYAQGVVDHEADEQFRLGMDAVRHGHAEEARLHFVESYAVDPQPNTLWNLALAEAGSNHPLDAIRHIRQWLAGPKVTPESREAAQKVLRDMAAQTGHIAVHGAAPSSVSIDGSDPSSLVQENGVFDVLPGRHTVETVGTPTTRKMSVEAAAGVTTEVRIEASGQAAPAPVPPPAPIPQLPVQTPTPVPDETERSDNSALRLGLTIGLGVGAVGLFAGAVALGAKSSSAGNDAHAAQNNLPAGSCPSGPGCSALQDSIHSANSDRTASIVLYAASAVLATGAIVSWFAIPRTKERRTAIAPLVGGGVLGAQWVSTF